MQLIINPQLTKQWQSEPPCSLFKHNGMLCCIQRHLWLTGNLNGYVAVPKEHPFYGKRPSDKVVVTGIKDLKFNNNFIGALVANWKEIEAGIIPLNLYLQVHYGVNYARNHAPFLEPDVFPGLWWFGFDTAHAGDMNAILMSIDDNVFFAPFGDETYKDYDYVKEHTCNLADQLAAFMPEQDEKKPAAFYYFAKA